MAEGIFITGTDTGSGKTVVTGLLKRYLREKGHRCAAHKWVQSGSASADDSDMHKKIGGVESGEENAVTVSYSFDYESSPHLAASVEGENISPEKIIEDHCYLAEKFDIVLSEGSGGLLVPYDEEHTLCDIVRRLNLPVLIVAANKLGVINHTLLTIEYLRQRRLKIMGIIFNDICPDADEKILADNVGIVQKLSGVKALCRLPYSKETDKLYSALIKGDLECLAG
jgi:dethiobiotin synthase